MVKFEGDWVKSEEVMANLKNRQMWDFGLWEGELGIGSLGLKYAEWDDRGSSKISRETE